MKVRVEFDAYETKILRKLRKDLREQAEESGKTPPSIEAVIRGAVRMGVHSVYMEKLETQDILENRKYLEELPEED